MFRKVYNSSLNEVATISQKENKIKIDDDSRNNKNDDFCWNHFQDFSSSTSLHGIKYLGESKRSTLERTLWLIMIALSVYGCGFMIFKIWKKWDQNPVIVTFSETSVPVWEIPFPAITICPEIKVSQIKFNYTEEHKNLRYGIDKNKTEEEILKLEYASMVCDFSISQSSNNYINKSILNFIDEVSIGNYELFDNCFWKRKVQFCNKLFSPIFTEDGKCRSFNMLSANELFRKTMNNTGLNTFKHSEFIASDSDKSNSNDPYPRKGLVSGINGGLSVVLYSDTANADFICSTTSQGFKISLHSPSDFPQVSRKPFILPVNTDMIIAIKPKILTTSEGLASYEPNRRNCYWDAERYLYYFQIYTQQNCQVECLSNYTKNICGCVAFWMPRNDDDKICSVGKFRCMKSAQEHLENTIRYSMSGKKNKNQTEKTSCNCLPGCTSIDYEVETSQSEIRWKEILRAQEYENLFNSTVQVSRIRFIFKDLEFIPSRRSELYGLTDFLANCGGILGLFLGFSILSLLEILYFLTVGPVFNMKRKIEMNRKKFRNTRRQKRQIEREV